eukprot:2453173-Pleurochrysis_carterae.AAC.2
MALRQLQSGGREARARGIRRHSKAYKNSESTRARVIKYLHAQVAHGPWRPALHGHSDNFCGG